MNIIARTFHFQAEHWLTELPDDHPLTNKHRHNYSVVVRLQGPLDEHGWVYDYQRFEEFDIYLMSKFGDRIVNDQLDNPTAERVARFLFQKVGILTPLPKGVSIHSVTVREDADTEATWVKT